MRKLFVTLGTQAVERMATAADWDVWSKKAVVFPNIEAGRVALQNEELLEPFFAAWNQLLDQIEAAPALRCSTALARKLPKFGPNILMIGEAGAGKSTLVKVMTGDEGIRTSATHAGTYGDTVYKSPCRINWVDTPGFKLPVSPEEAMQRGQSVLMRWKDDFAWGRWLSRISSIMSSHDMSTRPSAVVYCHRASSRVMPKRLLEMWSIPHAHAVPLIVCLTDVCGVDDAALKEVRKTMAGLVKSLGPDAVNRDAQLIEINSEHKTVRGHQYKVTGVKQLLEAVVNALDPAHALQLITRAWLVGDKRKAAAPILPPIEGMDGVLGEGEVGGKRSSVGGGSAAGSPSKRSRR